MNHKILSLLSAGLLIGTIANAQLVITSGTQSTTIDFQSDVGWSGTSDPSGDNVYKYNGGSGNHRNLLENASTGWTGTDSRGFSADAWSWSGGGLNIGMGSGTRSLFGDYNNDTDFADDFNVINAVSEVDLGSVGLGAAGDNAYDIGSTAAPWRDYTLTLRVQNTSGVTISDWSFSLDAWYADADNSNTTGNLLFSTNNVDFTPIASFTTTNTGGASNFVESDLSGSISASVANGDYLYLQFANSRVNGSGSGGRIIIDNWTVATAIPEPSTYALLGGAAALGLALLRRRRA